VHYAPAMRLFARVIAFASLAAAPWLAPGCTGTDVGNGVTVSLDLRAYQQLASTKPLGVTMDDGARVDELWMVVDRIRLRPGESCAADDTGVDVEGPLVADLLGGGVLGGAVSFTVPAGPFCEFRMRFHKLEGAAPAGAPADLAELSILMKGVTASGVPFTVQSDLGDDLRLDATNGTFSIVDGETPLFLAYELRAWMAALDLGSLPGPSIVVSDDQNEDRLDAFEAAVKQSARLFRDRDEDGDLSPDEHEPGRELAGD
jgi:hypothetical protein